ncbi:MAG TPA: hypothetical protein VHA53_04650 [Nitrolancea sp.]|nr:hypothetical protein [Nitrolancea sp.]
MSNASNAIKGVIIAGVISLLCLAPPIVHFVTGPLGPAIGGYVAGTRLRLTGGQAAFVGLILGIVEGVLTPWLFVDVFHLIPDFSTPILVFFGAFVALYVGLLSGAAAWYGGNAVRNDDAAEGAD